MKLSLATFKHRYDCGHDWYIQLLHTKRWALFQASVSWNDWPSWPYIQVKSGNGSVLNLMFWAYRFGLDVGLIERTWNWERIEAELNEQETDVD